MKGTFHYENSHFLVGVLDLFGDSDDWDRDGLKNGEEIEFDMSLLLPCIKIHSNPCLIDSDGDNISDFDEVSRGSSPKKLDFYVGGSYDHLFYNSSYNYTNHVTGWQEDFGLALDLNKKEEAKMCMINFLYDYASKDTIAKNAEAIAKYEKHKWRLSVLSTISNITSIYKSIYSIYSDAKKVDSLNETPYPQINADHKNLVSKALDAVNTKRDDALINLVKIIKTPDNMMEAVEGILSGDAEKALNSVEKFANTISSMAKTVQTTMTFQSFHTGKNEFSFFLTYKDLPKNNTQKAVSTGLTIACDVLSGLEEIAEIQLTYGKIKANYEAFTRSFDMLVYVMKNAQDDFVRLAARELAEIIANPGQAFDEQLTKATLQSATGTIAKTILDSLAKDNQYAFVLKTFFDLVPATGFTDMIKYNIYFKVMRAISDGYRTVLENMDIKHGETLRFYTEEYTIVKEYLVQLAQSRIIGEYYNYEYIGSDSVLSWLISLFPNNNYKTPSEYKSDGKNRIKTIYDHINYLGLEVSENLPYYNEFYNPNLQGTFEIKDTVIASGRCGENLVWELTDEGILTILGSGDMEDYDIRSASGTMAPWYSKADTIIAVNLGQGITSIGDGAFFSCHSLRSVMLPYGVKRIGKEAFSWSGLSYISIPETLLSIDNEAFYMTSLSEITLPERLAEIGSNAFGLTSIANISIPASVTEIGAGAFHECPLLKTIRVDSQNAAYKSLDGVLYSKDMKEVIKPELFTAMSFSPTLPLCLLLS